MRFAICLFLGVLSALLYSLSFPPASMQLLAWVALVPVFVAIRWAGLWGALLLTWVFTVATAYLTGDWFPAAVSQYYVRPAIVGIAFFFGVSSIMAAPCVVAFAAVYRGLARRWMMPLPLLTAAAWVAGELGRARLLTGNPWVLLGYSQAGSGPVVQVADLAGVYGVSFVLAAVNAALAEIWIQARSAERSVRPAFVGLALAGVAVVCALVYGDTRLRTVIAHMQSSRSVPVAIAQANLDLGSQWRRELYGLNLDTYLRLTLDALRDGSPELVFWPENAMSFFLDDEPLYRDAIGRVLSVGNVQLVAGGPRYVGSKEPKYYNSAFLISAGGKILAKYDKQELLPFAEYFPFASLDFLRRNFGRVREFTPGEDTPPLPTAAGAGGVVICNEALFPEIVSARVRSGAEYVINLSNDSWLKDRKFSEIALGKVVLRAVEQRRYVVRSSTSGPSAVIDPVGRVVVRTEPLSRGVIAARIGADSPLTIYNRVGDLFAIACVAIALAALLRRPRVVIETSGIEDRTGKWIAE